MPSQSRLPVNTFLLLLAATLVALAVFYQWKLTQDQQLNEKLQAEYQQALSNFQSNNIYYDPKATVQWIQNRQNPDGYFVTNPDMIFEPSQLNANTLRATRYAISTLLDLDALDAINRKAVAEFVIRLYQQNIKQAEHVQGQKRYNPAGSYAGFRTITDHPAGVRPTMDALIILDALGMLDDPRLNLAQIKEYILSHQNADGGFWDEHYPRLGTASSIKCTSFASRALEIVYQHNDRVIPKSVTTGIRQFVQASLDKASGGYAAQPGKAPADSYDNFRAFISVWSTETGSRQQRKLDVSHYMDINTLLRYLTNTYYIPSLGAFSRYNTDGQLKPSIKTTHLIVWLMTAMNRMDHLNTKQISKFVVSQQTSPGQYGGDIYTTYSAIGLLQKMGISTESLPAPKKPVKIASIPGYLPTTLFLIALATLALGYLAKKNELENLNKALSYQASIDGLTGIYNRQRFETLAKQEIEISKRYKRVLSLILIDADNFKSINDTHGHITGDKVLREIADLISSQLRDADVFARWGGEEFIILTPETDKDGAIELAEKLRRLIAIHNFKIGETFTCSFGVTQFETDNNIEDLILQADTALYTAKRQGKNKVVAS